MAGKKITSPVIDTEGQVILEADTVLDEENIIKVLESDARELKFRNNNVRGIEVQVITDGVGVVEPLKDRIVGRVLAEDIINEETGEVIARVNDDIDEALAMKKTIDEYQFLISRLMVMY